MQQTPELMGFIVSNAEARRKPGPTFQIVKRLKGGPGFRRVRSILASKDPPTFNKTIDYQRIC